MATSAMDVLITRLELADKFSAEAKKAKGAAKELADEIKSLEDAADHADGQMQDFADGLSGFKRNIKQGFLETAAGIPVFSELAATSQGLALRLGSQLATAAARVTPALGTVGLAAAAALATTAMVAAAGAAGFLAGAVSSLVPVAVSAGQAFATGLAPLLALPFLRASAEIDMLERQLGAFLGSAAAGSQMVKFVQQYSMDSLVPDQGLYELVRTMVIAKLDVNKVLPSVEALALGGGPDLRMNAQTLANAIRYAAGGRSGEAVENLGQIGIGRADLVGAGAKFDNTGRFIGTLEEFIDVLIRVGERPEWQNLAQSMGRSEQADLDRSVDMFRRAMQDAGKVLAVTLLPVIRQATTWLQNIIQSGVIQQIAASWGSLVGGETSVVRMLLAHLITVVEVMPRIINLAKDFVLMVARVIDQAVMHVANVLKSIPPFRAMGDALLAGWGLGKTITGMAAAAGEMVGYNGALAKNWLALGGLFNPKSNGGVTAPLPNGSPLMSPETEVANAHLAAIERNTRELVEVNRVIMGGGELGRLGVSAVDVFGRGPRSRGGGHASIGSRMEDLVREMAFEMLEGDRRARGLA